MGLDKTALVTGGGTGVGRAVALALAGEGCRVAVSGRREEKLLETAALRRGEPRILTSHADVADRSSVERLFDWAARELGLFASAYLVAADWLVHPAIHLVVTGPAGDPATTLSTVM